MLFLNEQNKAPSSGFGVFLQFGSNQWFFFTRIQIEVERSRARWRIYVYTEYTPYRLCNSYVAGQYCYDICPIVIMLFLNPSRKKHKAQG